MSELTAEERALLGADEDRPRRGRPPRRVADETPTTTPTSMRGSITPAQWDDDGWGDTPVQMRS
jgi:hypothetical protein